MKLKVSKMGLVFGLLMILFVGNVFGQNDPQSGQNKNAGNRADNNLKSLARINPSTLAMEMSLPMMNYPGRNGNSLPIGISYSSKLWRMRNNINYFYTTPEGYRQYVTQLMPEYGERTAAGWSSSLAFPVILEKLELYDQVGNPFTYGGDFLWADDIFANAVTSPQNTMPGPNSGGCDECNYNYGFCDSSCSICSGFCYNWCQYTNNQGYGCPGYHGPGGGASPPASPTPPNHTPTPTPSPTSSPTPTPTPLPTPFPTPRPIEPLDRMHYVKRVNVRMGDGSVHEFRKSDAVFGYCAGGPYDGPNCEAIPEDNYGNFLSVDGSGMRLERTFDGSTLYLPNGSRYLFSSDAMSGGEEASLYAATDYIDGDGNTTQFKTKTIDNKPVRQTIDTLGREIEDFLPKNYTRQEQTEGPQEINFPGLPGEPQTYYLKWLHLKPVPCTAEITTNCGITQGALENQEERLYHYSAITCSGSAYELVDSDGANSPSNRYPNEIMFPQNGWGLRSCNPLSGSNSSNLIALRFNPVVLGEVTLPNGQKYEFKYNQFGEITKIIYPTGSYETFRYDKIPPMNGYNELAYDQTNRGVVERKVYRKKPNGEYVFEQRWQYSVDVDSGYKITTTAPKADNPMGSGIRTVRILHDDTGQEKRFGFSDILAGMPKEEIVYAENDYVNPRSRTLTEYVVKSVPTGPPNEPNFTVAKRDARVKRTVSIAIENGLALATLSENEYETPGANGVPSDADYFAHLNVKRSNGYHYAVLDLNTAKFGDLTTIASYFNPSLLASVSETDYSYNLDKPGYKARGIASLPIESRVLNPANNQVIATTQTVFDETAYLVSDSATLSGNLATTWVDLGTTLRGKPTTAKLWDNDNNTWIQTHTQYNQFGNVRKVWEASTAATYDATRFAETEYSADYGFAYPTQVITPGPGDGTHGTTAGSFATTTYDFMTGLPLSVTNEFGQTTKTEYNDALLRPTRTFAFNFTAPESQTIYDDNLPLTVKVRKQIDETNWDEATTYSDSFGRTIETQTKDSQGDVFTETEYDFLGRVKRVTNPYRLSDNKILWSKPRYDEMGRMVESYAPEVDGLTGASLGITQYGISTQAGYVGTIVTNTDASGRKSRSLTNGLGQLIRIDEPSSTNSLEAVPQGTPIPNPSPTPIPTPPPDPPGCYGNCLTGNEYPAVSTYYRYNAQGKMVEVTQGAQKRYFLYDSLGRLIRVRQPEQEVNAGLNKTDTITGNNQWTAGFTYDVLGNVLTATDANGTVITNAYDKASRVITKTYSNEPNSQTTPAVEYFYDGKGLTTQQSPNYAKGKLTKVTSSVSETRYTTFDNLGRLTQSQQITDGQTYTSSYQYNFAGALVKETYPSLREVKNEFEADGDLSRIYGKANPNSTERTYANGFSYTADGKIQRLRLGNGRWESAKFNDRLQVTELALGTADGDGSLWKLAYEYGELNPDGTVNVNKNTGNIAKQTLTFNGLTNPLVQTFKYDSLYRLTEARETSNSNQTWKENFGYDRYGNRTGLEKYVGTTQIVNNNKTHPTIDPNTNRFNLEQGYVYDKNGNIIQDVGDQDAVRTFVFNGDNKQRFVVQAGKTIGEYFYDGEGKRVKKVVYEPNTTIVKEETVFVYSAGKLVEEYSTQTPPSNPTTSYTATDQLGSPRVITDSNGNVVSRRDFMPFGEEITNNIGERAAANLKYGVSDGIRQKFTGYQKDEETGLDFAEARMYENRHGRFTAVDPLLASGKSANPQTFNRFVYTSNNPISRIDINGKDWIYVIEQRTIKETVKTKGGKTKIVERTVDVQIATWVAPDDAEGISRVSGVQEDNFGDERGFYALHPTTNMRSGLLKTSEEAQAVYESWVSQAEYNGPTMSANNIGDRTPPLELLLDFTLGTGPTYREFGPGSYMVEGMRTSPEVDFQRSAYCASSSACNTFNTFRGSGGRQFGPIGWGVGSSLGFGNSDGAIRALPSLSRSFVGSFSTRITEVDGTNHNVRFELENTTGLKSAGYRVLPDRSSLTERGVEPALRNPRTPFGFVNIHQKYWWVERNPCGCN